MIALSDQAQKFLHRCPHCGQHYRVAIRVDFRKIHRALCPHCKKANFFDNRNGALERKHAAILARKQTAILERKKAAALKDKDARPLLRKKAAVPTEKKVGIVRKMEAPIPPSVLRPKKQAQPKNKKRTLWKWALVLFVLGAALPPLFLFSLQFPEIYLSLSPRFYMAHLESIQPNRIYDRDGKMIAELFSRRTGSLTAEEIPLDLKQKLVFVEDQFFHQHGGIHWTSLLRAFYKNVVALRYTQGASTITQQLARILLGSREKVLLRKVREAALAFYLEAHYSKAEILTAYMNHVYLGHGSVGMDTAANFYFDGQLKDLGFVEKLILVCLPSAPERYSPLKNPRRLERKMDLVYARMGAASFPRISEEDYALEKQRIFSRLNKSPTATIFGDRVNAAPFVTEYVRRRLKKILGEDYVYGAALSIETTIDGKLQQAAQEETKNYIHSIAEKYRPVRILDGKVQRDTDMDRKLAQEYMQMGLGAVLFGMPPPGGDRRQLQSASIGVEPATGAVLFLQGGTEFSAGNQFNRALQMRRQTGSAIKPIVYSAAIESGVLTTASRLDDTPIYVPTKKRKPSDREYWLPGNISGVYEGSVSVRRAIVRSKNIPAIRTAQLMGIQRLSKQFKKFFFPRQKVFNKRFRYDDTVAIGSLEMSPFEMAVAFSAFGNNGVIQRPYLIKRIVNADGDVIYDSAGKDEFDLNVPVSRRVLPGDTAEVMASVMADAARSSAARGGIPSHVTVLGKTGTTNEYRDTWFAGLVPGLAAAVWVGYDNPKYSMHYGTATAVAAPLWMRIVKKGKRFKGGFKFSPNAVRKTVCADSGLLPLAQCPIKVSELFTHKHTPTATCNIHTNFVREEVVNPAFGLNRDTDFD